MQRFLVVDYDYHLRRDNFAGRSVGVVIVRGCEAG
jgi:hypothetical protein